MFWNPLNVGYLMASKDNLLLYGVLGVGAYLLFSKSASAATRYPQTYPPTRPPQQPAGSKSGGGGGGGLPMPSGGGSSSGGSVGTGSTTPLGPGGTIDQTTGPGECADGTYVDDVSMCPENQTPVDSMDPCDPNSSVYDPTTCYGQPANTGTTPGYVDSMDPCDPNSSVYDPTVCYSYQNPVDSMDPCDPNSVAYDENVCAGYL